MNIKGEMEIEYQIGEASQILGVSDETLRNWEKEGKIKPFYTEGGHRRYYKSDIEYLKFSKQNESDISISLYGERFGDGNIVEAILNKRFGFELIINNRFERHHRILSLDQVKKLKMAIENVLKSYDEVMLMEIKK